MTIREHRRAACQPAAALAPSIRHQFKTPRVRRGMVTSWNGDLALIPTARGIILVRASQHKEQ
jgi:hypothetical protein